MAQPSFSSSAPNLVSPLRERRAARFFARLTRRVSPSANQSRGCSTSVSARVTFFDYRVIQIAPVRRHHSLAKRCGSTAHRPRIAQARERIRETGAGRFISVNVSTKWPLCSFTVNGTLTPSTSRSSSVTCKSVRRRGRQVSRVSGFVLLLQTPQQVFGQHACALGQVLRPEEVRVAGLFGLVDKGANAR